MTTDVNNARGVSNDPWEIQLEPAMTKKDKNAKDESLSETRAQFAQEMLVNRISGEFGFVHVER
ncbi:MAG: hypothetical protein MZU97_25305 [Bacillus subtilis]|nr:hypothetical protein [Bacillus subtilis]